MEKIPRVGIFDSGIGGLTVLHACVQALPHAQYFYFGDNLRAPYGSRDRGEVTRFVEEGLRVLEGEGVDAVILACNTATALAAERMREIFPFPVLGMEPALLPAAKRCKNALVLATPATAGSERFSLLLKRAGEDRFTVFAPRGLAAAVERAACTGERIELEKHLPAGTFDGVVLGCTHYIYLKEEISAFCSCPCFDGNEGTVRRLTNILRSLDRPSKPPVTRGEFSDKKVIFLGNSADFNKFIYNTNKRFQFIENFFISGEENG